MDIYGFIQIIIRNIKWIIIVPVLTVILMVLLTRDQPQTFKTSASVFTGITTGSSLETLGGGRVDYFASQAAYNNMITILGSRSIIDETSLRLLALCLMMKEPDPSVISPDSFWELKSILPDDVIALIDYSSIENTYQNLINYKSQDKNNFLYGLLNFRHPHFSHRAISKMVIAKDGTGDIIRISYESSDPGLSYHTLRILIDVFISRYSDLKKAQTGAVVDYFEQKLKVAAEELNNSEDRLLEFNKANSIINFYEQTKHISSQQETIELTIQDILMDYQAALSVLEKLEAETRSRYSINLKTTDIMQIRGEMIMVNEKLAEFELGEEFSEPSQTRLTLLDKKLELENMLKEKIDSLYIYEQHSDGIAIETLLNDWLKTVMELESSKARLKVMQEHSIKFNEIYTKFAPLGAMLKRIEREINVKEREYLEILHHLGLAKLRQQNEQMMTDMKILDPPQLPIDAAPTKRKIYVAVATVFSMIFVVMGFLVFELLDKTIKTPERFSKLTGLSIAGAVIDENSFKGISHESINSIGLKSLIETIIYETRQGPSSKPWIIQFFSLRDGEGKSHAILNIKTRLEQIGFGVDAIAFDDASAKLIDGHYISLKNSLNHDDYTRLVAELNLSERDIILIEVPALSQNIFNTTLYSTANSSLLLADVCRTWSTADEYNLQNFRKYDVPKLQGLINKMLPYGVEILIGDIPKNRSRIRKFIKNRLIKKYLGLLS